MSDVTPGKWHVGHATSVHELHCDGDCYNIYADGGADVTHPCAGLSKADAEAIVLLHNAGLAEKKQTQES